MHVPVLREELLARIPTKPALTPVGRSPRWITDIAREVAREAAAEREGSARGGVRAFEVPGTGGMQVGLSGGGEGEGAMETEGWMSGGGDVQMEDIAGNGSEGGESCFHSDDGGVCAERSSLVDVDVRFVVLTPWGPPQMTAAANGTVRELRKVGMIGTPLEEAMQALRDSLERGEVTLALDGACK